MSILSTADQNEGKPGRKSVTGALDEQVALVTGAARGLGFEIAKGLAAAGAVVLLNGRSREALDRAAEEIIGTGGKAVPAPFDITDEGAVTRAVDDAVSAYGRLDVLVNNVGVREGTPPAGHHANTQARRRRWPGWPVRL